MFDPIERLAGVNPERDCPPPPIEEVWRRIDAEARTGRTESQRPYEARQTIFRHLPRPSAVMVGLSSLLAVGIAVLAITQLSPRRSGPQTGSPGASALMARLAVLRRPQTGADRLPAHVHIVPRAGTIIPRLTRLVYASAGTRMYTVVVTPAVHNQMWSASTGDQVAIVAVVGHRGAETVPIPAADLSNADEAESLSPRGYARGGPIDLYTVAVVPDGVARVKWQFVNGAFKPGRTVDVTARDNAAISSRETGLLWRAAWYDASAHVIPTSDAAFLKARAQMLAGMAAPVIRYLQHHPQPTPPVTSDYAVFSITSATGVRTAEGEVISAPPVTNLPWDILASARHSGPFGGGQPDYEDVRHVLTPSGGNVYVIPGPFGICLSSIERSPFPDGLFGGGGGGSCTENVTQAENRGVAFTSTSFGKSTTYRIVPKTIRSITVRGSNGARDTVPVPYGVYVSPPFTRPK
jgi:hypothetical protein